MKIEVDGITMETERDKQEWMKPQILPANKPQSKWLSIEESLPEMGTSVLLYQNVVTMGVLVKDGWIDFFSHSQCEPSYWMPLPEKP